MSRWTDNAKRLPWVHRVGKGHKCQRLVNAPMSMYFSDVKPHHNQRSTDPEDYRCKNSARWHYRSTKSAWWFPTGYYCWSHLISILLSMHEEDRRKRWEARYAK